jgi:hypothetical protein
MNKKVAKIVFGLALAGVVMPSRALNFAGLNQRNAKRLPVTVR